MSEIRFESLEKLGFPNYRAGEDGSIWSWKCAAGTKIKRWKQLKPWPVKNYMMIGLRNAQGKRVMNYVHRLVLESFIGPCPEEMEGCHENNNPENNQLNNLRWDTPKSNCADRSQRGVHFINTGRGDKHGMAKLNWGQITEIRKLFATGKYKKVEIAKMFKITPTNAGDIINNKIWRISCVSTM